jgi:hypothetical protein
LLACHVVPDVALRTRAVPRRTAAVKPELPADFEEAQWAKLRDCIIAVHCKRPVATSLEQLYTV